MNIQKAEEMYNSYLKHKTFVIEQYNHSLIQYKLQLNNISCLYEEAKNELIDTKTHYQIGEISLLEYESLKTRVNNILLNMKIIELYVSLYEMLVEIN